MEFRELSMYDDYQKTKQSNKKKTSTGKKIKLMKYFYLLIPKYSLSQLSYYDVWDVELCVVCHFIKCLRHKNKN